MKEVKSPVASMLRVNHAGEHGAVRIYQGQQAVLGDSEISSELQHMLDQEKNHRQKFEKLMTQHRIRPTLLSPLWHVTAYALGCGSALLGKKAAMACTVAVEEVIEGHYQKQLQNLYTNPTDPEIKITIEQCLAEEVSHKNLGLAYGASGMAGYTFFTKTIKQASKLAIWLSSRF